MHENHREHLGHSNPPGQHRIIAVLFHPGRQAMCEYEISEICLIASNVENPRPFRSMHMLAILFCLDAKIRGSRVVCLTPVSESMVSPSLRDSLIEF